MKGITNLSSLLIIVAVIILLSIGIRQILLTIFPVPLERETSTTLFNESDSIQPSIQPPLKQGTSLIPSYLDENAVWNEPEPHFVAEERSEPRRYSNSVKINTSANSFTCEGKQRCSEMTSCAEAMFYLKNCPFVEIDGDLDGIPCEDQFCGH